MSHLREYRFLAFAARIEDDPARKARLTAALRKLEQLEPTIRRNHVSDDLRAPKDDVSPDAASNAA